MTARYEIFCRVLKGGGGLYYGSYFDRYEAIAEATACVKYNYFEARVYDTQEGEVVFIAKWRSKND